MKYILIILISFKLQAIVEIKTLQKMKECSFDLCVGDFINLKSDKEELNGAFIFAGENKAPNLTTTGKTFISITKNKFFVVEENQIKSKIKNYQNIIDTYPQVGGTCTGYALFNFLLQLNQSIRSVQLNKTLETEEGRSQLLADAINQYYLVTQHKFSILGILNSYGKNFGFKCTKTISNESDKIKNKIILNINNNQPTLISFNIGRNMSDSPLELAKVSDSISTLDQRIWTPRKVGDRNNGGHSVVIANGFNDKDNYFLMMIDSDWDEPRVWSLNNILSEKVATDEIELYSCK